jgi:cobaltochelatase CobT
MSKPDLACQRHSRRATAGALRAVAHAAPEVQVAFQPGAARVSCRRVRLASR